MPTRPEDFSKIKTYAEQAAARNYEAAGMAATATTLPDEIMNAVRTDRQSRGVSKLATDVGNVMGQMVTDPNAIRGVQEQGLMDPFSVNQLTSNARAQNLRTLGTISMQEAANQGSLDQVIQAGANQLKARAATMLAEAQKATEQANTLQAEWDRMFKEKQAAADEAYRYAALNKPTGGGGGLTLEDLFRYSELTQGEQTTLTNWTTAKNSIASLTNLSDKDFQATFQSGLLGNIFRLSNPTARTAYTNVVNLKDLLARSRTGAAINPEEEKLYTEFVQGDPIQTLMGYKEGPKEALKILEGIANKNTDYYSRKEDVARTIYDTWAGGISGMQGGGIRVRVKATGQTGTLDSEAEFDPAIYERL